MPLVDISTFVGNDGKICQQWQSDHQDYLRHLQSVCDGHVRVYHELNIPLKRKMNDAKTS